MPIYYDALHLTPSNDDPVGFRLSRSPTAPKDEPEEMTTLRREFARAAQVIATIFEDDQERRVQFFLSLHAKASIAFIGCNFNLGVGRDNLKELQDELGNYGLKLRSKWLSEYTKMALFYVFGPTFILGLVVFLIYQSGVLDNVLAKNMSYLGTLLIALFWIPAGAAFCVWAE
jgi:hypothetical protein